VGPVPDGGQATFQVQVTIPADAECNAQDLVTVTAWDSTNTYSDSADMLTVAAGDWQLEGNSGASPAHWLAFACTDDYGTAGTCFYAGGLGAGNAVTGAARKYDINSGLWSTIASLPTPVFGAVGGYVGGRFCVAGGFTTTTGNWGGTYATQCYNPTSNSWAAAAVIPGPPEIGGAGGATGGATGGLLHVVGGCGTNACSSNQHFAFDGSNWTQLQPVPDFLVFSGAAVGEGKLFVGGEYTGAAGFYEYDSGSDSWVTRAGLPGGAGKKSPVGAVVPGGGVFWWGGDLGAWSGVQDTTWYYEPNADGWVQFAATLNQATTGAGGGLANGVLWSFGGSAGAGPIVPPPHESLEDWCVPPPPDAGALEGVVYDANTVLPVENARVWVAGVTDPGFYAEQLTNTAGQYSFQPILAGDYLVTAAAYGYSTVLDVPVTIVADATTVLDFGLDASDPDLQPKSVSVTVPPDSSETFNMTLDNDGTGDLHFHITDLPVARALSPDRADLPMPRGVDPQVTADLEASVDGTARFVVYLKEQADLSAAFSITDWSARGRYVLDTLRATAQRSQAGLRAELDGAGAQYESRYIVNAMVVRGDAALADRLVARPEVGFIGPDTKIPSPKPVDSSPAPESPDAIGWNIGMIMANSVWTGFGVTGQGIVLSNIDSGVQYDHPALVQQYRGNMGGSFDHDYNWFDPYEQCPSSGTVPCDPSGHGTHTMGTMVGSDNPADPVNAPNAIGVAPGARWIACKGGDAVSGYLLNAELIECAEWILAPWDLSGANPDPEMRPDAVNNSWGGGQAQWWYNQAIYAWRAAGIWPSFSNGNNGPSCGTTGDPGEMDNAIAAGATNSADTIANFSSRGPAPVTGLIKPDVSAPGDNVRSSVPTNAYASYSGTSMASPHVAATAGLIWSAVPELRGNVQITEWIMEQAADVKLDSQCGDAGPPNNVYGWGRINAYDAVDQALAGTWDVPWLTVDPVSGVVEPAGTQPIVLTFGSTGLPVGECYAAELKVEYNDPYIVEEFIPVEMCVQGLFPVYLPLTLRSAP
jgi:subtilisin family serine protease